MRVCVCVRERERERAVERVWRELDMAGGHVMAVGPIRHYEGRTTVYVALACILAASGGLIFGYDIGISGTQQK